MDEHPYQPTLLSLGDMLNLSEDDELGADWSSNPYNIHNFFEPIVSPVKSATTPLQSQQSSSSRTTPTQTAKPGPSSGSGSGGLTRLSSPSSNNSSQNVYVDPFATPPKRKHPLSPRKTPQQQSRKLEPVEVKPEEAQREEVDDFLHCLDMNLFHESLVNAELQNCEGKAECIESQVGVKSEPCSAPQQPFLDFSEGFHQPGILESSDFEDSDGGEDVNFLDSSGEFIGPDREGPTLEAVRDGSTSKPEANHNQSEKYSKKRQAIRQLDSLIAILKRYSRVLGEFLVTEGDLVLEHYNAQTLLSGVLLEMAQESEHSTHPFEVAHSITKSLVDHLNGRTALSTLPPRRSHTWRTSELLMLQMAVLESAIVRKEFLVNCRYTDLLTEMGFDAEDLLRLKRNPTKEMELGTLKIIMNEHNFLSKSQFSKKLPIRTVIIRRGPTGGHRALVLPSPERLVEDKWKAVTQIRRRTTLGNLKDEDIDWLFVLKKVWMKNPKLKVDETACKLTYDHFISFKSNRSQWQMDEVKQLQNIREKFPNASWAHVTQRLGTNRTPFSCFAKYKAYCVNDTVKFESTKQTFQFIQACYEECKGNLSQLDHKLQKILPGTHKNIKPRSLFFLFRSTLNPRYKKGSFSIVEDAALFATMEKYKKYLLENDGMMDPVSYALPWRNSTCWRIRFGKLLTSFFCKTWTIEDDKCLLQLVDEYGPNYKIIQRSFPHKNRKQCRSRYLKLAKISGSVSLEEYHLICPSGNNLRIRRLDDIAKYLLLTLKSKIASNVKYVREIDLEFLKLRRVPREGELENYLTTFPTPVLMSALNRLTDCLKHMTEKWKEMMAPADSQMPENNFAAQMTGFDRRTFDPDCPASVASALHLRKAKLLPQEVHENLSPFEENVYNYYKFFSLRRNAKRRSSRSSIPALDTLRKLTRISRLIENPIPIHENGSGQSVIMQVKTLTVEDKAKEEASIFQELENRKLGGSLKGSKRKKTLDREKKQKAALIRWGRKKLIDDNYENGSTPSDVGSPWSTDSEFPCPSTPSSVASCSTAEGSEGGTDSASGPICALRRAVNGVLGDHAYILPMQNPYHLSSLPLSKLFILLGQQKSQRNLRERNGNS